MFKEGEEVILHSKNAPQFNGEYTVLRIFYSGEWSAEEDEIIDCGTEPFVYDIGVRVPMFREGLILTDGDGHIIQNRMVSRCAYECSLRKKYPPSDESFDELMRSLKSSNLELA